MSVALVNCLAVQCSLCTLAGPAVSFNQGKFAAYLIPDQYPHLQNDEEEEAENDPLDLEVDLYNPGGANNDHNAFYTSNIYKRAETLAKQKGFVCLKDRQARVPNQNFQTLFYNKRHLCRTCIKSLVKSFEEFKLKSKPPKKVEEKMPSRKALVKKVRSKK